MFEREKYRITCGCAQLCCNCARTETGCPRARFCQNSTDDRGWLVFASGLPGVRRQNRSLAVSHVVTASTMPSRSTAVWPRIPRRTSMHIRDCTARAALTAPHGIALFAMAANRLDDPVSKLAWLSAGCPNRWLPDAAGLAVDQATAHSTSSLSGPIRSKRRVPARRRLFGLDVDLIFYDTRRRISRSTNGRERAGVRGL